MAEEKIHTQTVPKGQTFKLDKNTFKREGYDFIGWSESQTATEPDGKYTPDRNGDIYVQTGFTSDMDLWAIWNKIEERAIESITYVQLWAGGPLWGSKNIGADKPQDAGYYFWWGDIHGAERNVDANAWVRLGPNSYTPYNFNSNNTPTYNKSVDNLKDDNWVVEKKIKGEDDDETSYNVLDSKHDAACQYLGVAWRMPTEDEFRDLIQNCTWTWDAVRRGYVVNGKNSGDNNDFSQASIFLPAVGRGLNGNLEGDKAQGHYWQSIPDDSSPTTSASLYFDNYTIRMGAGGDNYYRYVGMPIRPVYDPSNADGAIICEGEYDGNTIITEDGQTIVTENHEIDSIIESSDSDIANTILTYVDDNGNLQTASNKVTKFYPDDEKQKNMWPQRGKNRWRELIIGTACNRIANQACRDEKGLTSVTIRSNVESIGVSAFNGCTKLGEVKFLYRKNDAGQSTIHNLRKIEKYAFSGCNNLKKMMLPRGVQTIEVYAFKDCTNLQTVRIPSGVDFAGVDVNNWAFNTMLSCTVRTISDDTSDDVVYTNLTQTQRNKFKDSGLYGYYPDVINTLPANVTFDRIQYQNTGTYLIPKGLSGYYAQIAGGGIPGQGPTLRVSNSIGWHASYNRKTVPYGGTSGFWAFFD